MERAKQFAANVLTHLGYSVSDIPTSKVRGQKRADLVACDESSRYIIEVKHRLEDESQRKDRIAKLNRGEVVSTTEPMTHSNRIDGILRSGLKQIDQTPESDSTFNLLWFHAEGMDADLKMRRARNTFYGLVHLIPLERNAESLQCFYFDYATSSRLPSVNGLVIDDGKGLELCLNEFATTAEAFRSSSLVAKLSRAVIDPREMESHADAMVLRSDVKRKDDSTVLAEIERLTSKRYTVIRISRHASSAAVFPDSAK